MALRHGHSHTSLREQPGSTFTNTLRAGQGTARTPELNDIATVAIGRIKSQDQHCIGYRDLYRATTRTRDTQARSHSRILPRPWRIPHAYRLNLRQTLGDPDGRQPGTRRRPKPSERSDSAARALQTATGQMQPAGNRRRRVARLHSPPHPSRASARRVLPPGAATGDMREETAGSQPSRERRFRPRLAVQVSLGLGGLLALLVA